jgi:MerR family mercuric resistance operon transcriptional regulator
MQSCRRAPRLSTEMNKMTIGTLAAAAGIKVTAIRFYERIGLLPGPPRSAGRHRSYSDDHLRQLRFIRRARELKFSTHEIKTLLTLTKPTHNACGEIQSLAVAHLNRVREEVAVLARLERTLSRAVKRCAGNTSEPCSILQLLQSDD